MEQRDYRSTQIANIATPAVGFILSIPGLIALTLHALSDGNGVHILTFIIFGSSLVISYALFTLYHIIKFHTRWGKLLKILDHSTIFLLIAGTYTPFTLVLLRGRWGWTLFATAWGIAVLGVIFKNFYIDRFKILGPLIYLAMGWLIVFAIKPAVELIPVSGLLLLLAGGFFIVSGCFFTPGSGCNFITRSGISLFWGGSSCDYIAVYYHVIS